MQDAELLPVGDDKAKANQAGIDNLLKKLENTLQPRKSQERGTRLEDFFQGRRHYRRRGQRMAEYVIAWEDAIDRLREVQLDVDSWDDLSGWLFIRGAGLNQERHERVLCALPEGDKYPIDQLKPMLIRFFPDIHRNERPEAPPPRAANASSTFVYRRGGGGGGGGGKSYRDNRDGKGRFRGGGGGRHRGANAADLDEEEEEEYDYDEEAAALDPYPGEDAYEEEEPDIAAHMQSDVRAELEALAT